MVEAAPAAALVVIEAELVLELLIVALDAPADLHESHEILDRDRLGDRGEPVFRGLRFAAGPLDQQPLGRTRRGGSLIAMSRADAKPRKARLHRAAGSLAPAHGLPRAGAELRGQTVDAARAMPVRPTMSRRRATSTAPP